MDARAPGAAQGIVDLISEAPTGTFDSALVAYGWNLSNQEAAPALDYCSAHGVPVHIAGIFWSPGGNVHVLEADPTKLAASDSELMLGWARLAAAHGTSLAALSIGFATLHPAITKVVLGVASAVEVDHNLKIATGPPIAATVWREAKAAGLLAQGVCVP